MKVGFNYKYIGLVFIVLIGILFRVYNFEKNFSFAHDQDLYSWIAKDIIVNHHLRLAGQVTSVDGVFIGSFYYYMIALFYGIFKMNPLSAVVPLTLIGLFNIGTFGFFLKRHFSNKAAIIGMIVWATTYGVACYERWSVPTQPTFTWSLWLLIIIFELYKGNLKVLPIYGFLIGFTWQLHIALLPILPIPIIGYFLGKNSFKKLFDIKNLKWTILGIIVFILSVSPFVIFEIKHNFSQIKSMASGINQDWGGPRGWLKLDKIIDASGKEFQQRIFYGWEKIKPLYMWILLVIMWLVVGFKRTLNNRLSLLLAMWIGLIILAQFVSKRVVSEYYFSNLVPIYMLVISLFISKINWKLSTGMIIFLTGINGYWVITKTDWDVGYYHRKQLVEMVKKDVVKNKYPCVAVNFIADPGVGVGFRYLFWYEGIKLVKPGIKNVPVYNISIPWQISEKDKPMSFGRFGLIIPPRPQQVIRNNECDNANNQLDPLLGYTE